MVYGSFHVKLAKSSKVSPVTPSDFTHITKCGYIAQEMNALKISANYLLRHLRYGFSKFDILCMHFVTKVEICISHHL